MTASSKRFAFDVFAADGVTPQTGVVGAFTWDYYQLVTDVSPYVTDAAPPTLVELGTGGLRHGAYGFLPALTAGQHARGRIDLGAGNFWAGSQKVTVDLRAEDWNTDNVDASISGFLSALAGRILPAQLYGSNRGAIFSRAFAQTFKADLSAEVIERAGCIPCCPAKDFSWRNQVRTPDGSATQDLTGIVVQTKIYSLADGSLVLSRRSDTNIAERPAVKQIAIDAGQSTPNLLTDPTGRGWWQLRTVHEAATALVVGMYRHETDLILADGTIEPYLAGRFEIVAA